MVESSGCAAFGYPAAVLGSLSDSHREETWAAEASVPHAAGRRRAIKAECLEAECPCRAQSGAGGWFRLRGAWHPEPAKWRQRRLLPAESSARPSADRNCAPAQPLRAEHSC